MAICPVCRLSYITEQPHDHGGWPGWDRSELELRVEPDPPSSQPVVSTPVLGWIVLAIAVIFIVILAIIDSAPPAPARVVAPQVELAAAVTIDPAEALHGVATHFPSCHRCAAAGADIRDLLGADWKDQTVTVCLVDQPSRCVATVLTQGCACGDRSFHGTVYRTLIDLSKDSFQVLEPDLGVGVIEVTVELGGRVTPTLPPTDTEGG